MTMVITLLVTLVSLHLTKTHCSFKTPSPTNTSQRFKLHKILFHTLQYDRIMRSHKSHLIVVFLAAIPINSTISTKTPQQWKTSKEINLSDKLFCARLETQLIHHLKFQKPPKLFSPDNQSQSQKTFYISTAALSLIYFDTCP